jgi:S-adenosylmethionine:tRNA ribosyltransferase-isomerase
MRFFGAASYHEAMADADLYDYQLPPELIAQEPLADRAAARLLVVDRATGSLEHRHVGNLPQILRPGDLVVVNDTRVIPARLVGRRVKTGGRWEGLFLRIDRASGAWELLANTRGRPEIGERVMLTGLDGTDALQLTLVGRGGGGAWLAIPDGVDPGATVDTILNRLGRMPLPGYIRGGVEQPGDRDRYQTVFARQSGSAAAPTAGLHFTESLLAELDARGIGRANVTLHVGLDTFRPISAERLDDHPMHTEWCECPPETVTAIAETKARGGRVVAVGTTAARTLETAARGGTVAAWSGSTDLFIRPGFQFHAVDCLLTNFHMPRTTLMVLVSTFASRELIAAAYEEAIGQRYRFLSYGDAMLIQ